MTAPLSDSDMFGGVLTSVMDRFNYDKAASAWLEKLRAKLNKPGRVQRPGCPQGTFGLTCENACPANCAGEECDTVTGVCIAGCVPGYLGDSCTSACSPGTWGPACENTCGVNCLGTVCQHENGTCTQGCMTGYEGSKCDSVCTAGTWGELCEEICEAGCSGGNCDHISGYCSSGCVLGYNGPACDKKNNIILRAATLDVHVEKEILMIILVQDYNPALSKVYIKFENEEPCDINYGWVSVTESTTIQTYNGVAVNTSGYSHRNLVNHMFSIQTTTVVNVTLDNLGMVSYDYLTLNVTHVDCYENVTINSTSQDILAPFQAERSFVPAFFVNWPSLSDACLSSLGATGVHYTYAWKVRYTQRENKCWRKGQGNEQIIIYPARHGIYTWITKFQLTPNFLPIGFYIINVITNTEIYILGGPNIHFSKSLKGYIEITQNSVRASLGAELYTSHLYSEELLLNASFSRDPDGYYTPMDFQFVWTCVMNEVMPCSIIGVTLGSDNITMPHTGAVVTLGSRSLQMNNSYRFEVTVSAAERLNGTAQRHILISNDIQPENVQYFDSVFDSCESNCGNKLVLDVNWVVALNQTQNPKYLHSWSRMNLRWSVYHVSQLILREDNSSNPQLTVDASLLHNDTSYSIHLEFTVQVTNDLNLFGSTQLLNVITNELPVIGSCDCSSDRGFADLTRFTISCTGFYDIDVPLTYRMITNGTGSEFVICENCFVTIACPDGEVIDIQEALYGRENKFTCLDTAQPLIDTTCSSPLALDRYKEICVNKTTCTVTADNSVTGDPYSGTYKYARIVYRCEVNPLLSEGGSANFSDVMLPGGPSHTDYYSNITVEVTDQLDGMVSYQVLVQVYPSLAEYTETINQSPVSSSGCVVSPLTGHALVTNFTVACGQFTDLDLPLTYYLYYKGETESLLCTGNDTDMLTPFYLGEGLGENNTAHLVFRAKDVYKAATDIELSVQVLPYNSLGTEEDILDFVQNTFLSEDTGETSGLAVQTIGTLGNIVNEDTKVNHTNHTQAAETERLQLRTKIRESLTESLLTAQIEPNLDVVNQVAHVLDALVKVKEEVTEKQEVEIDETTVAVFSNLAEKLNDVEKTDAVETRSSSKTLLNSMGSLLTVIKDRGTDLMNTTTTDPVTVVSKTEKLEKVKRNSLQMMASVGKVVDVLTGTIQLASEPVIVQTLTMAVRVQEIVADNGTETNLTLGVQGDNSSIGLVLPPTHILRQSVPGGDNSTVYTQIVVTKDNLYSWDKTAERVTSSVVDVVIKDRQLQAITLTNMSDPVTLQFDVEDQNVEIDYVLNFTYETATSQVVSSSALKVSMTDLDPGMASLVYIKVVELNLTLMVYTTTEEETMSFKKVQQNGIPMPLNYSEDSPDMLMLGGSQQYLSIAVKEGQNITANHTDVPFITADVLVRIATYKTMCGFYDNVGEQWATDGCLISPPGRLTTLACTCDHLTAFAAGFIVVPHLVDPIGDAALFLTFFDNPIVVITVMIVWCLYLVMVVWARRKDRIESMKGGVSVLEDNCAEDKYVYVVGLVTGWWRHAGTTSNVFMCLRGDQGHSSKHLLSDGIVQHFDTGAEDWFVMTTPLSLGELHSIVVWHDNSGDSASWFLKQIVIRDVQTDQIWHFLYNDWLAVDQGIGQIKAEIQSLTQEDLVQNSLYQFGLQSSKDLQNNHLWISIISCPASSPFTRVQRLSCALSLLLTTMLASLMFHGIPTDDPADQLSSSGITLSLSDIVIGIESGLLMFPVNFIIMQLFTRLNPRPSVLSRGNSSQAECPKREGTMFEPHTSMNKDRSKVESEKSSKPQEKKPFRFPWWVVYIAWALVLSTALISSYFVMLYGLTYGYQKSIEWLVSFFTAFFQSAFVTQPLKVFVIAVLLAFIFKKPVEFEVLNQRDNTKLDPGEDYCQTELLKRQGITQSSIAPVKQPVRPAMPRQALKAIRERLRLEEHITTILREMIMYFTFVAVVLFMVHGHQDVATNYGATRNAEDMLVRGAYTHVTLTEVKKVEDMWKYLHTTAVPVLYSDTGRMANDVSYLAGTARLRQKRIENGLSCHRVDTDVFAALFPNLDCEVPFSAGDEEWRSFNTSWAWPLSEAADIPDKDSPWKYRSSWELKTIPYVGRFASYSGGGYVTELPTSSYAAQMALNDLRSRNWVDKYTRAIFLEFTSYNPNVDMFTVAVIIFELSNIGNIMPYYQFFSSKLNHYDTDLGRFVAVCESLFLVYLIGFTYFEVKKFMRLRKAEYFSDNWSYLEIMIIVLGYCTIGLFFQRLILVDSVLLEYGKNGPNRFTSFYTAVFWDFILTYVMAALVMLVILKVFKLFRFNTKTTILMQTLANARGNLLNFALLFFICFMAFALFANLVFGYWLVDYKDVGSSIITLSNFLLGVSDYTNLKQAHSVLGPAFFFMFAFLIQYILLSVFVAIILEAQSLTRKAGMKDIAFTKFVCERFLLMIGFLRRSDYK